MSEYQYYEWQTIDRLLTDAEQAEVNRLSSHIEVGASQAVVTYEWGDFKHDPRKVLARFFDAFLYQANWGTSVLMFRFPAGMLDKEAVAPYCMEDAIEVSKSGEHQILEFKFDDENGGGWIEEYSELSSMVSLRNDVLESDLRCLYLAWLKAASCADPEDWAELEEPPVPAGLRKLTPALDHFAEFFNIDEHHIQSAATASLPKSPAVSDRALRKAIQNLTRDEADDFLLRLARGETGLSLAFNHRLKSYVKSPAVPEPTNRRTADEIFQEAERLAAEETIRKKVEAEESRVEALRRLANSEPQLWQGVEAILQKGHSQYAEAVAQLVQLRDLADFQKTRVEFDRRMRDLRVRYAKRPAFMERLNGAGLK